MTLTCANELLGNATAARTTKATVMRPVFRRPKSALSFTGHLPNRPNAFRASLRSSRLYPFLRAVGVGNTADALPIELVLFQPPPASDAPLARIRLQS